MGNSNESGYHGWSAETEKLFRRGGWYPGRNVEPLLRQWDHRFHQAIGTAVPAFARPALLEFGGIKVESNGPGIDCARDGFVLDPTNASFEFDRFEYYASFLGESVFPLGDTSGGSAYVAISESGKIYVLMCMLVYYGDSAPSGLGAIVEGRHCRRLHIIGVDPDPPL